MGMAKREWERWEDLTAKARIIAEEVGAISIDSDTDEAEYNYDVEADRHAYARATILWKAGKLDGTRKEVVEAVKDALDNSF
jgi:hypothetical protein